MNRPTQWRPAEYYITDRPTVDVPWRICALLDNRFGLRKIRTQVRGADAELDSVLSAIGFAAAAWRSTVTGTTDAVTPEPDAQSDQWVNTSAAATLLGITDRAIRKAIVEKRLAAEQVDGRWRITREDVEHFRAARAA